MKDKVKSYLIKWGNNSNDVNNMLSLHFDWAVNTYKNKTAKEVAEVLRTIY